MESFELTREYLFNGHRIRFEIMGEGPPLVIIHGTPWSSFNLRHLCKKLAGRYTVHVYDLLGYGQSDKTADDVSLGIQNRVLAELLDHWQLERPAVIGHDFGGATLLRAHLLDNRDFSKIILIDPVAVSPWGSPFFRHVRAHEAAFAGVPGYIHEAIVKAYIQTAAFHPLEEKVLSQTVNPWLGKEGREAFYRQIAQADSRYTDEVEERYDQVTAPVLILWGEEDIWIPIERGRKLHRMISHSLFQTVADAGHLVIEERPDQLLKEIIDFL